MNNETQNIAERYERRKNEAIGQEHAKHTYFNHAVKSERELKYTQIFKSRFDSPENVKILEIGAGSGGNLFLFKRLGLTWQNIHANELLPDRFELLKQNLPDIQTYPGDACAIDEKLHNTFDIVFQSTVFTSILDSAFKQKLANKMWDLTKPGGIVLWYDFAFDNPKNKDVKGIKKAEVRELFKNAKHISFSKTTLAPPIGRRVKRLYHLFNIFPFLRTHLVAVIEK